VSVLDEVLARATRLCSNEMRHGSYDPGKWALHVEKVSGNIWGLYEQTEDSTDGDVWEAWLVSTKGGFDILAHRSEDSRFYHDKLFEEWLASLPYGVVQRKIT
jgi:hypothetical protein